MPMSVVKLVDLFQYAYIVLAELGLHFILKIRVYSLLCIGVNERWQYQLLLLLIPSLFLELKQAQVHKLLDMLFTIHLAV